MPQWFGQQAGIQTRRRTPGGRWCLAEARHREVSGAKPRQQEPQSGARVRTSIATFRAWNPAGWTTPERWGHVARALRPPPGSPGARRSGAIHVHRTGLLASLCHAARKAALLSMPLAYPSTLDRRQRDCVPVSSSYVEELWSPMPRSCDEMRMAKPTRMRAHSSWCTTRGLSLSGGASNRIGFSQAEHHLWRSNGWVLCPETTKATQLGRPRTGSMRARKARSRASQRGRGGFRTSGSHRCDSRTAGPRPHGPPRERTSGFGVSSSSAQVSPHRMIDDAGAIRKGLREDLSGDIRRTIERGFDVLSG